MHHLQAEGNVTRAAKSGGGARVGATGTEMESVCACATTLSTPGRGVGTVTVTGAVTGAWMNGDAAEKAKQAHTLLVI